jgi:hypothetical protein
MNVHKLYELMVCHDGTEILLLAVLSVSGC